MEEKEAQKKKVVVQSDLELTPADRGLARSPRLQVRRFAQAWRLRDVPE
jgi:hypothetical protein